MLRSALLYRWRISASACAALPRLASAAAASLHHSPQRHFPSVPPSRALSSKSGAPDVENEDMLKLRLTPLQYEVCRNSGTEPPFSNEYWNHKEFGTYYCRVCDNLLYESTTKFDSGSGWPAFTKEIDGAVTKHGDESHGMWRTELRCARCRSHLGHLFFDGPTESKQRHCINSASLDFEKK